MKTGILMIVIGAMMFFAGLVMFYSISLDPAEPIWNHIKNMGTFVGLSGIGVTVAGILMYLINRNQPPIQESFEYKE